MRFWVGSLVPTGRDYYALPGSSVRLPLPPAPPPSAEYLEWHGDTVFRR